MAKTVGENEQEMRDILAAALEAGQEWAQRLVRKHGSIDEAVGS
jgi:hypothetical protein